MVNHSLIADSLTTASPVIGAPRLFAQPPTKLLWFHGYTPRAQDYPMRGPVMTTGPPVKAA